LCDKTLLRSKRIFTQPNQGIVTRGKQGKSWKSPPPLEKLRGKIPLKGVPLNVHQEIPVPKGRPILRRKLIGDKANGQPGIYKSFPKNEYFGQSGKSNI